MRLTERHGVRMLAALDERSIAADVSLGPQSQSEVRAPADVNPRQHELLELPLQ